MEPTIIFDNVSKKFSKGYVSDSLRDALAAPFKRFFGRNNRFEPAEPVKQAEQAKLIKPAKPVKQGRDEFWALKDVSFEVRPGEALGIIGPNGSGKSTTLKLLSRILRPNGGRIIVKGRVGALIELGSGFHPDLTGRENVFLNASILGMSKEEIEKKYDEIVDFAELHEFMDMPVKWYSSGMHARLGFSVAANTSPDILLVDEVLSVGDFGFQRKCFDKMKSFKAQGTTIVFVSHNLQAVASLCDRAILLSKGVVNFEGIPENVIGHYLNNFVKISDEEENKSISLKKGHLFDEQSKSKTTFKSGERGRAEIELIFKKDFPNIYISAYIRSKSESIIFSTNTMRLSGKSLSVKKGESALFSFGLTVNLAPGIYEFGTTVFDRIINKWIFNSAFTSLVIEENPYFDGIAFMDPKLLNLEICPEDRSSCER